MTLVEDSAACRIEALIPILARNLVELVQLTQKESLNFVHGTTNELVRNVFREILWTADEMVFRVIKRRRPYPVRKSYLFEALNI